MNSGASIDPEKQLISPALRSSNPELVTAVEIQQWADRDHAKTSFPELMRRLLAQAPGITNLDIRAHEGVAAPGWDGVASSTGSTYLPVGELRFEFGTNKDVKRKAQNDYSKRLAELGDRCSKLVFVFATPRSWPSGQNWVEDRRSEQKFADVRVIDAQRLEGWLQETPSVHYWLSEQLGRNPRAVQTLQAWWINLRQNSIIQIPPQFHVARRDSQSKQLIDAIQDGQLAAPVSILSVDSRDVLAFLHAILQDYPSLLERTLIVSDRVAWDHLVEFKTSLLLIPRFNDPDTATALAQGHRVLVVIDGESRSKDANTIVLPKVGRHESAEILRQGGVDFRQAERIAVLARRSMGAFLRMNSKNPDVQNPAWIRDVTAVSILAPLVLIGAWEDGDDRDKDHIESFCGACMSDIRLLVDSLSGQADSPFILSGSVWRLADPVDAARLLLPKIETEVIERWRSLVFDVLFAADPRRGLGLVQSVVAEIRGIRSGCSDTLRKHVAEGLTLTAATSEMLEPHVRGIVKQLLEMSFADKTGDALMSLASALPLLAEAAPSEFLAAISEDLDKGAPVIQLLFHEPHLASFLTGFNSQVHHLLWALECLCWSEDYFGAAAMQMAALAARDLGDRNQPLDSLHKVTAVWAAQSVSNTNDKIAVIEQVIEKYPEVGWRLVMTLLKPSQSIIVSSMGPRFRDWELPGACIKYNEVCQFEELVLDLAVSTAGVKSERWVDLIKSLRSLPKAMQSTLVHAVSEAILSNCSFWCDEDRYTVWRELVDEIAHHEAHPGAGWAAAGSDLNFLRNASTCLLNPSDPRQYVNLFGWTIDLRVRGLRWNDDGYEAALNSIQLETLKNVAKGGGLSAIRLLCVDVERPETIGTILASLDLVSDTDIIRWLEEDKAVNLQCAARAYVHTKARYQGVSWLEEVVASARLGVDGRLALAASIPTEERFWNWIEKYDDAFVMAYWSNVNCHEIPEAQCVEAISLLLVHERPWRALDVLFRLKCGGELSVDSVTVINVLSACLAVQENFDRSHYGYVVSELLKWLEVVAPKDLLLPWLEFCYFDFIGGDHDPSFALYSLLGNVPEEFVSFVRLIYHGQHQLGKVRTEGDVVVAQLAHSVLFHWGILPGLRECGEIDGDHLRCWVSKCRTLFDERGDVEMGDREIGKVLASSPDGQDGIWPAEEVRVIIESLKNEGVEAGLATGRYNRQGVSVRPVYDGGGFERLQAQEFRSAARKLAVRWPRTSMILRQMADGYEQEANHLDKWDEQLADE